MNCAPECGDNTDCDADKRCEGGYCIPWADTCKGGGFCTPCRFDSDCGEQEECRQLHGNEKGCFNPSLPDTCTTDADCPESPGGRHGTCLDERMGVSPGAGEYHRCWLPIDFETSVISCY
jgi:hypothetical protein